MHGALINYLRHKKLIRLFKSTANLKLLRILGNIRLAIRNNVRTYLASSSGKVQKFSLIIMKSFAKHPQTNIIRK